MAITSNRGYLIFAAVAVTYLVWTIINLCQVSQTQTGFYRVIFKNPNIMLNHSRVQEYSELASTDDSTLQDDTRRLKLIRESPAEKLILAYTEWWGEWPLDFSHCKHPCRLSMDKSLTSAADMMLFELKHISNVNIPQVASRQYKVFIVMESAAFDFNRLISEWNGQFNITVTYRRGSTIKHSIYSEDVRQRETSLSSTDYSAGKTKDMIAYVSNCVSIGYDRIGLMKELSNYGLNLDLYGKCGKPDNQDNKDSSYKFYLSFENSLCEDYITEKFWKVLSSNQYLIPVVMGGKSMDDYLQVAPPNSFIHVENFTTIEGLAEHLKTVASDSQIFNKYHKWREQYRLVSGGLLPACELCEIAHERPLIPARTDLSQWWNEGTCRTANLTIHPGK